MGSVVNFKQLMEVRKILKFTYAKFWKPKTKKQIDMERKFGKYLRAKYSRRAKIKRPFFNKKNNYKHRRYIGYYFRYARYYTRSKRFFLKNMMVIKRFTAYGSGFLRKRQLRATINKINSKIVRSTDARMGYILTFTGILTNALYHLKFAQPGVFKYMDQLICRGFIMLNERLARYPNMFVELGDKLEVVHEFWIKQTRIQYLKSTLNSSKKAERIRRRILAKKRESLISLRKRRNKRRQFLRRYSHMRDNARLSLVDKYIILTRRSRWKLRLVRGGLKKRKQFFNYLYMSKVRRRIKFLADKPQPKTIFIPKMRRIFLKKNLFKSIRLVYCRLLQAKAVFAIRLFFLMHGKKLSQRILFRLSRVLYLRFFRRYRWFPVAFIRRRIFRKKFFLKKYFDLHRLRRVTYMRRSWEVCMYARSAYRIKPIAYTGLKDSRFKKKLLLILFKNYSKFRF